MSTPILATKLYIPPLRPKVVLRHAQIERLNEGLHRRLTLISAPAGFGKTTLVCEWLANCERPAAWLSLDEGDNDPARFLNYLIAAVRTVAGSVGERVLGILQSPQPPPIETVLTTLVNDISVISQNFILVLDDYHVVDSKALDDALTFLLEHLPPQMHMVILTREDPRLPLARLRARSQLTELRVTDLRFTLSEAAAFLDQVMGLQLSEEDIAALETRTEGWIAGLQLAAISMQGHHDTDSFIKSFTGSHHFVMDYLVEEVLQQQPESVQTFLLQTSILERMCGSLCDAVLLNADISGQEALEYLERANMFIISLDNERRWYRYHHLFADLLRQRLHQNLTRTGLNKLHIRASQWFEDNGLEFEAFQHAAAANDIERAERLTEGKGIPLHLRGAVVAILDWLETLPKTVLDARPMLWWRYGSLLLVNGQTTGVEEKLNAAEAALVGAEINDRTRLTIGRIATARATLALTRYDVEGMLTQSNRALEYLEEDNRFLRANSYWTLGFAYLLQGDRSAARQAYLEGIALSQESGNIFTLILATIGLAVVQEVDNQLDLAAQTYRMILQLVGDQPQQIIGEVHLGMARILYEWNDLDAAGEHGRKSLYLSRQYDKVIDRFIIGELFLARLKLAQGDVTGAVAILAQSSQTAHQKNFVFRIPDVAAAQVIVLLRQGNVAAADKLAHLHDLPMSQARVYLAQGNTAQALEILETLRHQAEAKHWEDERLKTMVLQALALDAHGEVRKALQVLADALRLAEPVGLIRTFLDEGQPMAQLLSEASARGIMPDYTGKLLAAFESELQPEGNVSMSPAQALIEPLSQRELEILKLVARGLSNHEISEQLFLALSTVKGHNQNIFGKLQVQRRTEAVARARELGLI